MMKRLELALIGLFLLIPFSLSYAQEKAKVIVLPFEVYSQENLSHLGNEIQNIIGGNLEKDGAVVDVPAVMPTLPDGRPINSDNEIIQLGKDQSADYVIWGNLTQIGNRYSLDTRMAEIYTGVLPDTIVSEGGSIQNLLGSVDKLSHTLGMVIFKWKRVSEIIVRGNKRIEGDAVRRNMKTGVGDIFRAKNIADDIKSIYGMGYFDDVRVEADEGPDGKILTVTVSEKSTIRGINIVGNKELDTDDIKDNLDIATGAVLNIARVQNNVSRIENLYKEENYHNVSVAFKIHELDSNQVDVDFIIEEGEELKIGSIRIEGNEAIDSEELIDLMETKEDSWLGWFTNDGELNRQTLNQDAGRIATYYHNHGYITSRVGDPEIVYGEEHIEILIKVSEGRQYSIGQVSVSGDLLYSEEELLEMVRTSPGVIYSRSVLRNDVLRLNDMYNDQGYAYAEVAPKVKRNDEDLLVDINFEIVKKQLVYFERISITGNTKTRDKVIRRQLPIYERELYSGTRLKRGIQNVNRLDFFSDVRVNSSEGSAEDQMAVDIDVTEKNTGAFSIGGGYSTSNSFFAMINVTQKNLFGRGQILTLAADVGGTSSMFRVGFTEPWLFDIPLSAGAEIYKWDYEYYTYDKDSLGIVARFSYPMWRYTRVNFQHSYDISDIDAGINAPDSVKILGDRLTTHLLRPSIVYDSRNNEFNPTRGSKHELTISYAGLGGDVNYLKATAATGWYFPLFWGTVVGAHARLGYVSEISDGILPDWDKFRIGGINSMRGFEEEDLGPYGLNSSGFWTYYGGTAFTHVNLEYVFPIWPDLGIFGVVFYDTGNVWDPDDPPIGINGQKLYDDDEFDFSGFASSVGTGIRWASPFGPIRVEYGYVVDPGETFGKSNEERPNGGAEGGKFEFSMGAAF